MNIRETLFHKETKQLVKLAADKYYEGEEKEYPEKDYLFFNEKGELFVDNIDNYVSFTDEFDRPLLVAYSGSELPDISLKKYIWDDKTRRKLKKEKVAKTINDILSQLRDRNISQLTGMFCDGAMNWELSDIFIKKMKMQPLFKVQTKSFNSEWDNPYTFKYANNIWVLSRNRYKLIKVKLNTSFINKLLA